MHASVCKIFSIKLIEPSLKPISLYIICIRIPVTKFLDTSDQDNCFGDKILV